jgi:hypothetical protein
MGFKISSQPFTEITSVKAKIELNAVSLSVCPMKIPLARISDKN